MNEYDLPLGNLQVLTCQKIQLNNHLQSIFYFNQIPEL